MFDITKQDEFLAKQGVFTLDHIRKSYQDQSPRLAEYICKLVYLDPAPRQMFIEENAEAQPFLRLVSMGSVWVNSVESCETAPK